jgi:hypothetical protein
MVPPVTNPTALSAGSPRRSVTHAPATSSTAVVAGVTVRSPAFWSQAETSQSVAAAAGCVPPMTNPKNRPDDLGRVGGPVGQLTAEPVGDLVGVRLRWDFSRIEAREPAEGVIVRFGERSRALRWRLL